MATRNRNLRDWARLDENSEKYYDRLADIIRDESKVGLKRYCRHFSREDCIRWPPEEWILFLDVRFGPPSDWSTQRAEESDLWTVFGADEIDPAFFNASYQWYYILGTPQYVLMIRGSDTALTLLALSSSPQVRIWEDVFDSLMMAAKLSGSELELRRNNVSKWRVVVNPSAMYRYALRHIVEQIQEQTLLTGGILRKRPSNEEFSDPAVTGSLADKIARLGDLRFAVTTSQLLIYNWPDAFSTYMLFVLTKPKDRVKPEFVQLLAEGKARERFRELMNRYAEGASDETRDRHKKWCGLIKARNKMVHGNISEVGIWDLGVVGTFPPNRIIPLEGLDTQFSGMSIFPAHDQIERVLQDYHTVLDFLDSLTDDLIKVGGERAALLAHADHVLIDVRTGRLGIGQAPSIGQMGYRLSLTVLRKPNLWE